MPACDGETADPRAWAHRLSAEQMNSFTIKLFATLRERVHAAELTREYPDGTTVGDFTPRKGDEIAFIPPVSGGAATPSYVGKITIGRGHIDVATLEREVSDPA